MNSDFFTISASGFGKKISLDEMVDPSLYSSLDSDSPNGHLMYDSVADFCLPSSVNITNNIQSLNSNNNFSQAQHHFLQPIQFNQHSNLPTYDNSSLISPTVEELTFEDCCSEMLKLLDENDINSLVDMNATLQHEIDSNKVNFQLPPQPANNNLATEYILRNLYDYDECNSLQENFLLNKNLTLAQLNGPDFGPNSFDGPPADDGQSMKVVPLENFFVGNSIMAVNAVVIDPKLMSPSLPSLHMKREPDETKLFTVAYSSPGVGRHCPPDTKQIVFMADGFDPPDYHPSKNKVTIGSTLSQNQLTSVLKSSDTTKTCREGSEVAEGATLNGALKQDPQESILEAYLLSPQKEQPKPQPQATDAYEDFGVLWDICDEEEALSVNCDKKEVLPNKPNTRKARRHLDSETSVDIMTGDESDDQYQVTDDDDEATEFLMDLKNKDEGQRFFWQYNVLSKGPKGRRLCQSIDNPDPHILGDFQDPVFHQEQDKYKHNGKARRGDGNDVTPNPHKLYATGIELQKLNRQINIMAPCNDWPTSQKNKTLKERNKLASRACRLKKKAQHEANKLKLHGLKTEHSQLMKAISLIREILMKRARNKSSSDSSLIQQFNVCSRKYHSLHVAGRTAEYVNAILAKVASGDKTGGINLRN